MASDTNIKNPDKDRKRREKQDRRYRSGRAGGLTLRILAVNIVAPLVLGLGILYIGQYRESLIQAELETLKAQTRLFSSAISEGAVKPVDIMTGQRLAEGQSVLMMPDLARRMVQRLGETNDSRARLFNADGKLIADSAELTHKSSPNPYVLLHNQPTSPGLAAALRYMGRKAIDLLPTHTDLQPYVPLDSNNISAFPDAKQSLSGQISATAWEDKSNDVILTAAAPIKHHSEILGTVMLTREGYAIEAALSQVRFDVFTVFLGALSITIFMSLYLAGVIGAPLKKLAVAAEGVRQGKGRQIDIPDLSHRKDEIGELSMALRDMTQALWDRMDTIERFAADVAHEIKNPLTSLRSAVETAVKVDNEEDRKRLMEIIQHDIQRLDRLITDISNASRLDAALSRDEISTVDLGALIRQLVDAHRAPMKRGHRESGAQSRIRLDMNNRDQLMVSGNEGRLAQVFENLIANALSFTPDEGKVHIRVQQQKNNITVLIEDEGPGIPDKKLETIFERFYSERPSHESYGAHSGLGLSIAKQIIESHGGWIYAENRIDEEGNRQGARFTVILYTA